MAWITCSPLERRLLGEAWLLLLGIRVGLRVLPLPRVQALLRLVDTRGRQALLEIDADRLAFLVGAAARRHPGAVSCLERSLALQTLLRRCDSRPELKIGVRRESGALQAHAWVEVDGQPVGEAPDIDRRFLPFRESMHE